MNFKLNKKMLIFILKLSKWAKNRKKVPNSRRRLQSIVILRSPKAIGSKSFGDFVEPTAFRPYLAPQGKEYLQQSGVQSLSK